MKSNIVNDSFIISSENCSYQQLFNAIADSLQKKHPNIQLKKWMTAIIWRFEFLRNKIFNTHSLLTKSTANTAFKELNYSSDKIKKSLDFKFVPIKITINDISRRYLLSKEKKD
jgi:hypothetical protein